ncbi:conserved hypothetical protein [Vibrio nigripulchritudo SO65]|uniref:reverse transcriptase domain-containing protein n=1 Tax=Vibrio nigripulchritudo TaxID=28173 RepID=UPI0003B1876B|nr:reverse transcriptase domain-containing protein [Vibrio nigripulchritudo]CCN34707.1 conserved hypothetical protein [Vibrio nigripulchritudo AM115]CCN39791.1 conserved hypothetical protein [Vibrio nigripulchritudo FTn2]CCN67691.1 conserved hypothetical protein [Vibrio nigripulchritudo POn4]CCN77844.1 conserved hypothetical protein [Vibrio nigripulchritudo SO65]
MKKFPLESLFDIILHGKYKFSEFENCQLNEEVTRIQVRSRTVYSPSSKLKSFHYFLNMVLCEQLALNEFAVFSYRKGISTLDALKFHVSNKYFFQTDITSFYSSITRSIIDRVIEVNKPNLPISDIDKFHKRILDFISYDGILPTGFSTSPLISNSVLIDFDNLFAQYCMNKGLVYTRYSDDIIVSSKNEFDIDVEKVISGFLKELYGDTFNLNSSKSRYSHIGQRIKVLGMVVLPNGDITIDKKQKKEIEVLLHFYREDYSRFRDIIGDDLDKGMARISGILNYIKNIDESYYHKLMSKYGVTTVDILTKKAGN